MLTCPKGYCLEELGPQKGWEKAPGTCVPASQSRETAAAAAPPARLAPKETRPLAQALLGMES